MQRPQGGNSPVYSRNCKEARVAEVEEGEVTVHDLRKMRRAGIRSSRMTQDHSDDIGSSGRFCKKDRI